jgi:hypothetical protein
MDQGLKGWVDLSLFLCKLTLCIWHLKQGGSVAHLHKLLSIEAGAQVILFTLLILQVIFWWQSYVDMHALILGMYINLYKHHFINYFYCIDDNKFCLPLECDTGNRYCRSYMWEITFMEIFCEARRS